MEILRALTSNIRTLNKTFTFEDMFISLSKQMLDEIT